MAFGLGGLRGYCEQVMVEGAWVGSFQEIARGSEQQGFVGRGGELARFRANLVLPVTDPQRRFIFSIHGDGGVGKSTLLRRYRQIAAQEGAWCAAVDEQVVGVPETLESLAAQFAAQGAKLAAFHRANDAYAELRTAPGGAAADAGGWAGLIAQSAVKAGAAAAHTVPGAGAVADAVDAQAVGRQVDRIAGRGRRGRAARVSLDPVQALTAALVQDIGRFVGDRALALFFDTFEQTSAVLDPWLRALLEGRYGPLPQQLVVTVAGRAPLNPSVWSAFLGFLEDTSLGPFTETETRQLLAGRGLRDEETVCEIIDSTGGLPLLVAMSAQRGTRSGDLSGNAVERFLSGLDPAQRVLVSAAALARSVNEDALAVLEAAAGQGGDSGSTFAWLRSLSFVAHEAGVCRYHELVRAPLVTQARRQSPLRWRTVHAALAAHFATARGPLPAAWEDEQCRSALLEEWYHRLCADSRLTPDVLEVIVEACARGAGSVRHWVQMVDYAGRDTGTAALRALGDALRAAVTISDNETVIGCSGVLLDQHGLSEQSQVKALRSRGRALYLFSRDREALADFDRALQLAPGDAQTLAQRADVFRFLGRREDAFADLERALRIDPDSLWALGVRGMLYDNIGQPSLSLADYDRALGLDPSADWVRARRGRAYNGLRRFAEALADLDQVIRANPYSAESLRIRGEIHLAIGRRDLALRAIADLNTAVESDPRNPHPLAERALLHRQFSQFDQAMADLDRALQLDPDDAWALAERGETHRLAGRLDQALADFDHALQLDPDNAWALGSRGQVHRAAGRLDQAVADFDHALQLDPETAWALAERGVTHRLAGRLDQALADFDHALQLNPDNAWALGSRGQVHRAAGRLDQALADFDRALQLDPDDAWALAERGETHRLAGRLDQALADFDHALQLNPDNAWALGSRGLVHRTAGRLDQAMADLDHALQLDPENASFLAHCGETHRLAGRLDQALADLDHALQLDPDYAWALGSRGQVHRAAGRLDQAMADLDHALQLDPDYAWALGSRGQVHRAAGRLDQAMADLDHALQLDPDLRWAAMELQEIRSVGPEATR